MNVITYNIRLFSIADKYDETHGLVDAYYGLTREQTIALLPTLPSIAAANSDINSGAIQTLSNHQQMMIGDIVVPGIPMDFRCDAEFYAEFVADFAQLSASI